MMNPQLCETEWQTVHFIAIPEAIMVHRPQSQSRVLFARPVKQAYIEKL